ncbi:unconventional myosin-XVIIIa isoform X5 [Drosophila nasuta]|uniref:unconventional myosin-XVIIIa isoform X5 n=1 Tax=Drosophila nasuta TaxID=42062 RepID=UPI00295F0D79|nr:unconventional myosin-XVIIIa isoform X5 [Drosophila nasuta]
MYKHTVKSKLSQARSTPPTVATTGTPTKQTHALGASKKFFSHIRHKIEDNLTPKLSGKLYYKGSKHTRSMSALSLVDTGGCVGGKYTPTATVPAATEEGTAAVAAPLPIFASSNPLMMSSSVYSYVDSDEEESQLGLGLSLTQQSLEDEIFAELEKVAHDESKLNEVLQSFDQILQEYPPVEEVIPVQMLPTVVHMLEPNMEQSLLPPPPAQFSDRQLLAKSHSTLSMATSRRQQIYQTPELANSKLLRRSDSSANQRYNSLCELSQLSGSRIPISKHSSLRNLAKSKQQPTQQQQQQVQPQPRQARQQRTRSMLTLSSSRSQSASKAKPTPTAIAVTAAPPKRANSTLERRQVAVAKPPRRANSTLKSAAGRSNAKSDELLVKCLAKGQELLRKVETMNGAKARTSRGISKEHTQQLRHKKKQQQKLQYANEEKVGKPKLESCKIIPPKLGETSDKNHELLVKVVQQQQQQPTKKITTVKSVEQCSNSDSDDSGHISNTVLSSASNSTSNSTGSLCESEGETEPKLSCCKPNKIAQLLQKFEAKSNPQLPQLVATKVAQVQAVRCIQTQVEIYPTYTKEILFRSGVLNELEAKRDVLLSDRIIQLQAFCRGYLARKKMSQRRIQELAVRCIQRNVKAFLAVRDWPWWRLLVRVTPLLNVHRTEEQLKIANEELIMLRAKLEKIEYDRSEVKNENQKLEAKLSELTVDLAEERSTAHIATERLEAETGERLKLEKELGEQQSKVKNLQEMTEKLEMELICAKSDLNGISEDEDGEHEEGAGGVYKLKYERVARELEFTKRRLRTQHEHDLEQLVGLKKQLEKKLSDAYEEVEEQRQVVGQWKRKVQKMTNEMNDLRMLLEEQNARNNLLEKKQRKFDAECQSLQDASRQERQAKERYGREKDVLQAEKFTLEQTLADTRLDLELKEEKLASLQRELEEMTFGGGTEEEFAQLRRSKNETERRAKEQEEELDEMAGQIQLLEQAKLRLEMTLETMRKEARRESQQRDEELEEVRGNGYKKIKALECQLETEHEERTLLLREKHELERRLSSMEDRDRVDRDAEEAQNQKLRRDLRKYKALLKDAQTQLERLKADTPGKTLIRQLRNQLEDAESARSLAMKARQTAEAELTEVQAMFEESHRARNDAEERANTAHRDRAELQAQIEENEEELGELMKKYSATVKQLNTEQINVSESEFKLTELEAERNNLKEQVAELQHRLDNVESLGDPTMAVMSKRLEMRTKELESRLELEQATRARLEVQVSRHKESLEKLQNEVTQSKIREMQGQEVLKKSQKSLRDMREEFHSLSSREQESLTRRKDLEKKMEVMESEGTALKNDLRLALQRIADLQQAMEEEGEEELSESDESISSVGSISDLEDRLRPVHVKRSSQQSLNGIGVAPSTTRTIVCEKDDNSPRITVTSPSSPHIHKLALAAKAIPDPKPDTKTAAPKKLTPTAAAATPTTLSPKTGTTTAAASAAATTINGVDKP